MEGSILRPIPSHHFSLRIMPGIFFLNVASTVIFGLAEIERELGALCVCHMLRARRPARLDLRLEDAGG